MNPWLVAVAAIAALVGSGATAADATVLPYDFDGDGRQDLAVGLPRYQPAGAPDAGAVIVLRGTRHGVAGKPRLIDRDTPGVPGVPFGDDIFGYAVASADFDRDSYADLAVDVPGDFAVHVIYGSREGVTGARTDRVQVRTPPLDFFYPVAATLAAADLDGDGHGDLAVGSAGAIRLYFGARSGLSPRAARTIRRPRRMSVAFGDLLALGDVNGDGHVDLVEAAPGVPEDDDGETKPGHVVYCPGTPSGPRRCRRIAGGRQGPASLAIADVTGDGYRDIVEGIPRSRTYGDHPGSPGVVAIVRGGPRGPGSVLQVRPGSPGIPGENRGDDQFGASVASADVDRDGYADIVAGAPGTRNNRGRVTVIRGGPAGYATAGNVMFDEDTAGVPGRPARSRVFGASVSFLDADGDGSEELVVGVPGARGGDRDYGAVTVIDRPLAGPGRARARLLTLRAIGVTAPEAPGFNRLAAPFGAVLGQPGASSSTGYAFY